MLVEAFDRLLDAHCPPAVVRSAEAGSFPSALAAELEASGFLDLLVPESAGGAGLPLAELFPLAVAAGSLAGQGGQIGDRDFSGTGALDKRIRSILIVGGDSTARGTASVAA